MKTLNLKLILIIFLIAIIGGIIGFIVSKMLSQPEMAISPVVLPKEFLITPGFISDFYDNNQKQFKMTKDSQPSLEATYYGLNIIKKRRETEELGGEIEKDIDQIFDKIRSYYNPAGYYFEEGQDLVETTRMALKIETYFPQSLDREINIDWVKNNSLENEDLEEEKLDPQYQRYVLEVYRHLNVDQKELKSRISPLYLNYYCNFDSEQIPDQDYLRQKYYQISIITHLTGLESITNNCLRGAVVKTDKERLDKISFKQVKDIKEVYWLYYLNKFYLRKINPQDGFERMEEFYSDGGFKEKISDKTPNLIGTFYAVSFAQRYFGDYFKLPLTQ